MSKPMVTDLRPQKYMGSSIVTVRGLGGAVTGYHGHVDCPQGIVGVSYNLTTGELWLTFVWHGQQHRRVITEQGSSDAGFIRRARAFAREVAS